ncbi:MBG domain-containing protein [Pelagicoccus sp. SDUM812005]|uniref:MBG domain-containing protein n=1 Tax=Pelagicoccus sp. SDUM812005 TaxID=3041257 RepID=UPI00280EDD0C|nr:MBG domain-containing protein [Pelagicoccus sp. SDUM812005]MDQ8180403.1 MBG domain-containing protein [Pelagicoccus sp. SDUM812005]
MSFSHHTFTKPSYLAIAVSCALSTVAAPQNLSPSTLPSGGNIVSGNGAFQSAGSDLTVLQYSDRLIAEWSQFDIGSDASVSFSQPNSDSIALNRILSENPTQIFGQLESNGRLFLVNPNGIVFGESAQVNVGGLVASSLQIDNNSFLTGDFTFSGIGGSVANFGNITAQSGGVVALVGQRVQNDGSIITPEGTTALLAGSKLTLDFDGDGLINYSVTQDAVATEASNAGLIQANAGTVIMSAQSADSLAQSVVNNTGIIEAQGLKAKGGRIFLDAGEGSVNVQGDLLAASATDGGGYIQVTGNTISVDGESRIDVSGTNAGGQIYVGGGWQGSDPEIHNAQSVSIGESVKVFADALDNGNGGTVVFWSDDHNAFSGRISSRGGDNGGDGGQVEVSGKNTLAYSGITDARAPHGNTGDLLLDPSSIDIVDGGTGSGSISGSVVYEKDLEAQLANITLQTSGGSWGDGITLNDLTTDGVITLQDNVSLTIIAGDYFGGEYHNYSTVDSNDEIAASGNGAIYIRAAMSINSGKLSSETGKITLWGDNGLTVGNSITTNGGGIELWADSDNLGGGVLHLNQPLSSNGGDIDLDAGTSGVYVNADISTGSGRLYFDRLGTARNATYRISAKVSSTGDVNISQPLQFGSEAEIETTGKLTFGSTASMQGASSSLTLTANDFDFQQDITGSGASVTIAPYDASTNVDIGASGSGDMTITASNMARFVNFENITVGRSDGTGTTKVLADTTVNFSGFLELANGSIDISSGTLANSGGDIVLTGDSFTISRGVIANSGNGEIALQQQTVSNPITIGSALSNSVLSELSAATLNIGRMDGGNVTFDGNITLDTNELNILSGGDITLGSGVSLDVGTGEAVLAAGGSFINNAGSSPIVASRWLIYSADPADNTFGGLDSGNTAVWNASYGSYGPSSVSESGNRYLFGIQPNLTFAAVDQNKTYGDTIDYSSPVSGTHYTVTGLVDASTYGNVFIQDSAAGAPSMSSSGAAASANVASGSHTINIAAGTLSAPTGYGASSYTNGTLTVTKADLTVTLNNDSKTYDSLAYSGGNGYNIAGFVNSESEANLGGSFTYGGNAQGVTNVGDYTLSGAGFTSGNYAISYVDGDLSVNKAALTVTLNDDSKTYDSLSYSGGNGYTVSGFVGTENESNLGGSFAYSGNSQGAINAGDYTITASGLTSGNYDISYVDGDLTVNKAALTVTANDDSKTYDALAYSGGYGLSYDGFVGTEDASALGGSVVYSGNAQGALNAGDYTISASGLTSGNYDISYVDGDLTVNKAALTVTANDDSKTYDALAYSGGNGLSYDGFVGTEDVSALGGSVVYSGNAQGALNAGDYTISASGLTSGNYDISYVDGDLTVNKAALTVTANDDSKTYDALAYSGGNGLSYDGFVGTEDASALGGSVVYGGNAQGALDAGNYTITASGLTSENYDITYTNGMLAVDKAALTVTLANDSKIYDANTYSGGNGYTFAGFAGSEDASALDGSLVYGGDSQGASDAGSYTLCASGFTSGNYDISYVDGTLTVDKAALTVTAMDARKTYDAQAFTGGNGLSFQGFAGNEDASALDGSLVYGGDSQGASDAGSYTLSASGLTSGNYDISYVDGTLTVDKAALTVTAMDASKTYDAQAYTGGNGLSYQGFAGNEDASALDGSLVYGGDSQGARDAGSYTLSASGLTSGNYDISYVDGTLTVNKAALTVTAMDASKTYDAQAYTGGNGLSYQGFAGNEDASALDGSLVYGGDSQGASDAGSYTLSASGLTSGNYDISYVDGTLTVDKAALTVTAMDASKTYDAQAYTGGNGLSYQGFAGNEDASSLDGSLVYGGDSQGAINAGDHTITASGLTSGNYDISFVDGTLTVDKAALTVTAMDASKTYDAQAYTGGNGLSYQGFAGNEDASALDGSLIYGGDSQGARDAGSYTLSASGLTSGNYDISFVDGTLTVDKAALTVTANNDSVLFTGIPYSGKNGFVYQGFAGTENPDTLNGSIQYAGSAIGAVEAGEYRILPQGVSSANYDISFLSGTLHIATPAAVYSEVTSSVVSTSLPSNGTSHNPTQQEAKSDKQDVSLPASTPANATPPNDQQLIVDNTGYASNHED